MGSVARSRAGGTGGMPKRWAMVERVMFRASLRALRVSLVASAAAWLADAAPAPSNFIGTWTIEQIPPGGSPRLQGTITITRSGNALSGTMTLGGTEVPLANVNDNGGGIISFSAP